MTKAILEGDGFEFKLVRNVSWMLLYVSVEQSIALNRFVIRRHGTFSGPTLRGVLIRDHFALFGRGSLARIE